MLDAPIKYDRRATMKRFQTSDKVDIEDQKRENIEDTHFHNKIDVQNVLKTHKNLDLKDYKPMLEEFYINSYSLFDVEDKSFYNTQDQKVFIKQKSPIKTLLDRENKKREQHKLGI